jgi:putative phosphoesterase
MRLGVLSDTHDQVARVRLAIARLRAEGAEALIHCGDLTGPDIVVLCAVLPCWFVFGNHDADNVPALQRAAAETGAVCLGWGGVVELGGRRIGVCHGHMRTDLRRVLAGAPDYLLSGHSHLVGDRREESVRRVNPGALHEADEFSVVLIDLATDEVRFFKIQG